MKNKHSVCVFFAIAMIAFVLWALWSPQAPELNSTPSNAPGVFGSTPRTAAVNSKDSSQRHAVEGARTEVATEGSPDVVAAFWHFYNSVRQEPDASERYRLITLSAEALRSFDREQLQALAIRDLGREIRIENEGGEHQGITHALLGHWSSIARTTGQPLYQAAIAGWEQANQPDPTRADKALVRFSCQALFYQVIPQSAEEQVADIVRAICTTLHAAPSDNPFSMDLFREPVMVLGQACRLSTFAREEAILLLNAPFMTKDLAQQLLWNVLLIGDLDDWLPYIRRTLPTASPEVQWPMVEALRLPVLKGELSVAEFLQVIPAELFRTENGTLRWCLFELLSKSDEPVATSTLKALLFDGQYPYRRDVLGFLAMVPGRLSWHEAYELLSDEELIKGAFRAIATMVSEDPNLFERYLQFLDHPNERVKLAAIEQLANTNHPDAPDLIVQALTKVTDEQARGLVQRLADIPALGHLRQVAQGATYPEGVRLEAYMDCLHMVQTDEVEGLLEEMWSGGGVLEATAYPLLGILARYGRIKAGREAAFQRWCSLDIPDLVMEEANRQSDGLAALAPNRVREYILEEAAKVIRKLSTPEVRERVRQFRALDEMGQASGGSILPRRFQIYVRILELIELD